jgi:hypothetical protein
MPILTPGGIPALDLSPAQRTQLDCGPHRRLTLKSSNLIPQELRLFRNLAIQIFLFFSYKIQAVCLWFHVFNRFKVASISFHDRQSGLPQLSHNRFPIIERTCHGLFARG